MSAMENHWGKAMGRFESIPKPPSPRLISDGFGFSWPFGRKRRARLAESKARQRQLADFWKAEQIRLNPNMAYLLSGASFEKVKGWTDSAVEQLLASTERGICRLLDGSRQMPPPFVRIPNESTICEVYK